MRIPALLTAMAVALVTIVLVSGFASTTADASLLQQRSTATAEASEPRAQPGVWSRTVRYIQVQQHAFYRKLAKAVKRIKSDYTFEAAWSLIVLSFLYGIFHAAGPGHGKTVISAYLLANEEQVKRGIMLAVLSSLMQAVTAIVIVMTLVMVLGMAGRSAQRSVIYLEQASYALICCVGLYMLWRALAPLFWRAPAAVATTGTTVPHQHHDHDHVHDENCGCGHQHIPQPKDLKKPVSLVQAASIIFAIGIRPCSGAVLVLVFANAIGIVIAGIGATFAMAVGTAITVSSLAILTLVSKNLALSLLGGRTAWLDTGYRVLSVVGAGLILLIGIVLLMGSFGPPRPFI